MEEFTAESFAEKPSLLTLDSLKKADLLAIAQHYKLSSTTSALKKGEIKKLIKEFLMDEELVPEDEGLSVSSSGLLELKRLEFEEREKERASQLRLKEMELREKELNIQLRLKELEKNTEPTSPTKRPTATFDVSKHIRFVPPFQEKEVDKYFLHFEKIATSLEWPRDVWMLLLQSVLVGKAREVYSAMSIEHSSKYDLVKKAILKAYELVPEAYRQNFRNYKKVDKQTYTEFAREKEALLDRWCASKEVAKDFEKLRQLILVEEFKACVPTSIKTYIDEQKATTLHQAAVLADDYSLTHRNAFLSNDGNSAAANRDDKPVTLPNPRAPSGRHRNQHDYGRHDNVKSFSRPSSVVCNYCKRRGHVMAECWSLQQKKKPDALVRTIRKPLEVPGIKLKNEPPEGDQQLSDVPVEKKPQGASPDSSYLPFVSAGLVSLTAEGVAVPVKILRDTGATQSLLLQGVLPLTEQSSAGASVLVQGVELGVLKVPLHKVYLRSNLVSGVVTVGVRPTLPIQGIAFIMGNDLAGGRIDLHPELQVVDEPEGTKHTESLEKDPTDVYPACVVTRSAARKARCPEGMRPGEVPSSVESPDVAVADMLSGKEAERVPEAAQSSPLSREQLIADQKEDPELCKLSDNALSSAEALNVPICYYDSEGVLMRKWRPSTAPANEEWQIVHQVVVPKVHRREVLRLAHALPLAGHLGINKTYLKILSHFYWPGLKKDVTQYCKSCHVCQMVGKPNQPIPSAPLQPIPVCGEPFSHVQIDCVGPLPKTKSGNQYLLTIMCQFTRFPEAIPLRNIKARKIVDSLIKFFTLVGLPVSIQSDQGSNFMSALMQQVMHELGVQQLKSSAYHPESQGAIERFHQTLKNMIRAYCFEYQSEWDQGIHMLLFAVREAVQDSLGFSPFELVFGRTVRGPLKLLKESWLSTEPPTNLLDQVSALRQRLTSACEVAQRNMKVTQNRMKTWYDKKAQRRTFKVGEKVLALLPLHTPQSPITSEVLWTVRDNQKSW